jgi:glutathione synthase/RimK-type ligase-like ATP-grasp enzyme
MMRTGIIRVGVATTIVPKLRTVKGKVVRRPAKHFCKMAEYSQDLNVQFFIFDPHNINWNNGYITGFGPVDPLRAFGPWEQRQFPLPHVIYENVFVHLAVKGYARDMRTRAARVGIPVFNGPLLNKHQMAQWLSGTELAQYIPTSFRLDRVNAGMDKIQKWGAVFLKPIGGYGGMGVTRIERIGADRFHLSLDRQHGGQRERRLLTARQLENILRVRRSVPHILQRAIPLLELEGRKVDFRVVVHRGSTGDWKVIGIVPKVAARDGVVTNLVAGGERWSLARCQELAEREGRPLPVRELETAALRIARKISSRAPRVGLIGFDLGLDVNGRVWMIEANPKPARSLLTDQMRESAARETVGYAVFLARSSKARRKLVRGSSLTQSQIQPSNEGNPTYNDVI